jgi:4-amino-4-deoxy-L-arabinose transferase-like glycosyltransferase
MKKIFYWIKKNKVEFILLLSVLLLGAFLRLYKISGYMTFLGDEGRDMVIIRKLLIDHDLVFVGPGTSVGNMYLGPFYYYLVAPFLWLFDFSPVGPSVAVALLGVATIFLIWYFVRLLLPPKSAKVAWGALLAAFLYATSPTVIILSRSSWNPNIMPFFALLVVLSLWKVWQEENKIYLILLGLFFAIVLQSHYLGLLLLPLILFFWTLTLINLIRKRKGPLTLKSFALCTGFQVLTFVFLMSPLVLFDWRHGWRNLISIQDFFGRGRENLSFSFMTVFRRIPQIKLQILTSLLAGRSSLFSLAAVLIVVFLIFWFLFLNRQEYLEKRLNGYLIIVVWLFFGILGLSCYRKEIYDHYFGFLFPAPFILIGLVVGDIFFSGKKWIQNLVPILALVLLVPNVLYSPLRQGPNNQLQRSINIAKKIVQESSGQSFNLAVISDNNYEGAYQYFLELWHAPVLFIDPQRYEETVAEQLFVVCEYQDKSKCQPTSNPKAEVANFGWSKIEQSWEVGGMVLFKLIRND